MRCKLRAIAASLGLLTLTACASAPVAPKAVPTLPAGAAIDAEVRRLIASEGVKGLALAVIDGGQVVHVAAFGARNVEKGLPLGTETILYGASLTKAVVAYTVLQLVDEHRVDLDAPVASYLPKPLPDYPAYADLSGDERWRQLTLRHILDHSTGFANFRWLEEDQKLRLHFPPGERYAYSGEGMQLLQFVLEEGLKIDLGAEIERRVFVPLGMSRTSMAWRADFAENVADGYDLEGKLVPHSRREKVRAAGSMDTTIGDQAKLWAAIVRGDRLSAKARAEMVRPQLPIVSRQQFPTLRDWTDPRGPRIELAAGLGVIVFRDAGGPMFYKGGHDDGTGNMAICQEAGRRCVVLLGNSLRAERIYSALVRFVLGPTAMPWWWEYGLD